MTVAKYNCKVVASSGVKVRPENSTSNTSIATLLYNTIFQISEKLSDMDDPTNSLKVWGKIFGGSYDGKFVALEYTGTPSHLCDYELIDVPTEPPTEPPSQEIAKTLDVIYHFESGDVVKFYRLEN